MNEKILQKMSLRADIYLRSLPEEHWLRVLHTRFENGSLTVPLEDIQPLIDCIARKPANIDVLKYGVKLGYAVRKKKPLLKPNSKIINLIEPVVAMSLLNKIPLTSKQVNQICEQFGQNQILFFKDTNTLLSKFSVFGLILIFITNMGIYSLDHLVNYLKNNSNKFNKSCLHLIYFILLHIYIPIYMSICSISIAFFILCPLYGIFYIMSGNFSIISSIYDIPFYNIHPSSSAIPSLVKRLLKYSRTVNNNKYCHDLLNTLYLCTQVEDNDNTNIFDAQSTKSSSLLLLQLNRMIPQDGKLYPVSQKVNRFLNTPLFSRKLDRTDEEPECYFTSLHNLRLPLMLGLIRSLEESGDASCLKTLQRLAARGYCPDVKQASLHACPIVEERGRLNQQPSTLLRAASGHDSSSLLLPATSKPMSDSGLLKHSEYPNGVTTSRDDVETVVIKKSE